MNNKATKQHGRRRFLSNMGLVTTAATLTAASAHGASSTVPTDRFAPAKHAEDAWFDVSGVQHRAFVDSSSTVGGASALSYANNILAGHAEGYGGEESDYSMVVCFRHQSTPYGYNDEMWAKYSAFFAGAMALTDSKTDKPFNVNPMNIPGRPDLPSRGITIDALIARGVQYAICNRATGAIAGRIAGMTGSTADAVYQELIANAIPNSRFVPAGVLAATRSQEYGYSLLYAG